MSIFVVTTNRGKFLEIASVLRKYGIEAVQKAIDVNEIGYTNIHMLAQGLLRDASE